MSKIAVVRDVRDLTLTALITELLEKEGHEVVTLEREPEPELPAVSLDFADFIYKPNRKERRADAARARRRR